MEIPRFKPISSVPRILIVRLSAHGDVIHTLPLLTALRKQYPDAVIGWLTDSSSAALLGNHLALNQLHVWPRAFRLSDIVKPWRWPAFFQAVQALVQELKAQCYELSLDTQGLFKSGMWPFLAKIPRRFGFKKTRENAELFYTDKLPPREIRSSKRFAVDQCLDLARALGCEVKEPDFGSLPIPERARDNVTQLLGAATSRPIVVLAPFTRWASKHWEQTHWIRLMQDLLQLPLQLVVVGAATDRDTVNMMLAEISESHNILNLAGKTDWMELAALLERTRLMIGLDSAPLHIANAVGVPKIMGIYGPTPGGRTGPIGKQHTAFEADLACQPCFSKVCHIQTHDCMRQITPAQVMDAVRNYLEAPFEARL